MSFSLDWGLLALPESQEPVTNGQLNTVVYELKNEMRDINEFHNKQYTELKHNSQTLNNTLSILSDNIKENSAVMKEISQDLKTTKDEIGVIKVENISRDYILKDLEDFKEETSGKLTGRFAETVKLVGIIGGVFGTIIVAIINIAPALFG